jgi:class 3 adenylate cyclase
MPIFLDRHDLNGATAADIAEAHRKDLDAQGSYGVKFLTYWFDEARGTNFCLVEAPDKETAQQVHRIAHGDVAGDIIEVALSAVEAFLGRVSDPGPTGPDRSPQMDAGHRTIMFTDIVGSTELTGRLGDVASTELVRAHDSLVRRALAQYKGREVKHLGDGIMASFDAASSAIQCADEIQRSFERFNATNSQPLHIRIGLDAGEPVADSRDLFGSTVQCAARLCGEAATDQILVSNAVQDECGRAREFVECGDRHLKGFKDPVRTIEYRWRRDTRGV